jgi:hypothetical protein
MSSGRDDLGTRRCDLNAGRNDLTVRRENLNPTSTQARQVPKGQGSWS